MQNDIEHHSPGASVLSVRQRLRDTSRLPAMPGVAAKLLALSKNPASRVDSLCAIVETDPSLAAQIMRFAASAFFGFRGEVTSLRQAITSVLGFKVCSEIALGISLGQVFNNPVAGPAGVQAFWRHAVYSACIAERVSHLVKTPPVADPGLAFLCGLLHNFGSLLLGHLFRKETLLLHNIIKANPEKTQIEIERQVLGIDHCEAGALLLTHWNLPGPIPVCAAEHHNTSYSGPHTRYLALVKIADCCLNQLNVAQSRDIEISDTLIQSLGTEPQALYEQLAVFITAQRELDSLAQQFAV